MCVSCMSKRDSMTNGEHKCSPLSDDVKVAVEEPTEDKRDVPVGRGGGVDSRKNDVATVVMRVMCVVASVAAVSFMVTARQTSMTSLYGFQLQLHSVWSLSDSLEYLVVVSSATAVYSLLQLLVSATRLVKKCSVMPTRKQAWFCFAADQIFGYAMVSGGSAALGVTNMNRTGIRHVPLPDFCVSLNSFCDHVAVSVVFALFAFLLLSASALLDVFRLSRP